MRLRWITDPPADGPTNMARDEALLHEIGCGASPPTLRFYRWDPATISLGYFQAYADYEALPPPAGDLAVVRRQTGGGAILHDFELTYSLTVPIDHPLVGAGGANVMYDHVHRAFSLLLTQHGVPITAGTGSGGCSHDGPFFCFERHSCLDLLADGRKLMGSAQRRTRQAVLQHGSLMLDSRHPQQQCATLAGFTDMDVLDQLDRFASAIAGNMTLEPGAYTEAEHDLVVELHAKYAGPAWTRKR